MCKRSCVDRIMGPSTVVDLLKNCHPEKIKHCMTLNEIAIVIFLHKFCE